jgi:hypothetical protein
LLGLWTEWKYLEFDEMPAAIRQRQVEGIVPLMLVLPEKLFDYSSEQQEIDGHTDEVALSTIVIRPIFATT